MKSEQEILAAVDEGARQVLLEHLAVMQAYVNGQAIDVFFRDGEVERNCPVPLWAWDSIRYEVGTEQWKPSHYSRDEVPRTEQLITIGHGILLGLPIKYRYKLHPNDWRPVTWGYYEWMTYADSFALHADMLPYTFNGWRTVAPMQIMDDDLVDLIRRYEAANGEAK